MSGHDNFVPASPVRPLEELRPLIDGLDSQIVKLLNDRFKLVVEVGRTKIQNGTPIYAPQREQAVLAKVLAQNTGPMLNSTLESIYREIMSGAIALERPLRIGYLGPPGSFSHDAAAKQFGSSVSYENLRAIDGVFEEVARGHVDYGLIPVENGSIGAVVEALDGFLHHCGRVAICAEVQLSVCHALISCPGAQPSDIREIHSKPEALAQCRKWLATQYPHAAIVPAASTSAAVQMVASKYAEGGVDGAKRFAAVASGLAAQLNDMPVMFQDIQDQTPNITRFLVLCSSNTAAAVNTPSGDDKTSVLFVCDDRPGALVDVLDCFRKHSINLTHIDKRPCAPENLTQLVGASDKRKLSQLASFSATPTGPLTPMASAAAAGAAPASSASSTIAAARPSSSADPALAVGPPRSPSPLTIPTVNLAPSLYVPAMLGGRGGLTSQFTYAFFVEAVGHVTNPGLAAALTEAAGLCVCMKVLGSFPRARRVL